MAYDLEAHGRLEANIQSAWRAFEDAVNAQWDAWSGASEENVRLRRIAEALSGIHPDGLTRVCMGHRGQLPAVTGTHGPMTCVYGPFTPAWVNWLNDAQVALGAVEAAGS